MKEGRGCGNRQMVLLSRREARVIEGIEKHLAAPDAVAEFVREYHRLNREAARGAGDHKRELKAAIAALDRQCARPADAIADGLTWWESCISRSISRFTASSHRCWRPA